MEKCKFLARILMFILFLSMGLFTVDNANLEKAYGAGINARVISSFHIMGSYGEADSSDRWFDGTYKSQAITKPISNITYMYSIDGTTVNTGTTVPANAKWVALSNFNIMGSYGEVDSNGRWFDDTYKSQATTKPISDVTYIYSTDGTTVKSGSTVPANAKWATLSNFNIMGSYGETDSNGRWFDDTYKSQATTKPISDVTYTTYEINQDPTITLTTSNNQGLSEVSGHNKWTVSGTIKDQDVGDTVLVKYSIDGVASHQNKTIATITANGNNQSFSHDITIDSTIAEGNRTIRVWAEDNKGGVSEQQTRTGRIDKTVPTNFTPSAVVNSSSQITISGTTIDPTSNGVSSGLHATPYNFREGTGSYTGWQASNSRVFKELNPNTQYTFNMQARDAVGNAKTSSNVSKFTLANVPGINLSTATQNSIAGSINPNGNPAGTRYFVQRATNSDFSTNVVTVQNWTSDTNFNASSLSPGTTYYFRTKARNGDNVETGWSSTVNKITAPAAPAAPTVTAIGTDSFNISWGSVTGATEYDLYRNGVAVESLTATSTTDTDLTPNTQYTYSVVAKNASGSSNEGSGTSKYTLALDAMEISVTGKTGNTITFSIENNSENGTNPQHNIQVKRKSDGVMVGESQFNASTINREVSGLSGGVEYEVWTITRNGDGFENEPVKRIDSIYVVTAPANITITETSSSSITVNWDTMPNHQYRLMLKDQVNNEVPDSETDWGITPPYQITGLSPNTLYKPFVQARQGTISSAYIEGQSGYTDARPVRGATFEPLDRAIKITLDIERTGNPAGTKYVLKNITTNETSPEIEETWTDTGLINDMSYQYMAKVINKNGKETEWFLIGTGHTAITEVVIPPDWEDPVGGLPPSKIPDDFDPDNIEGKVVDFNGTLAIVVKGRYINISIEDVQNATKYAISLDGFGYSDWKDLDATGGFHESIFINQPGLYKVHVKFQNLYGGESKAYVRNYLVDWIEPDIKTDNKIKGQTATTNGTFAIKATGQDNLSTVLYSTGSNWHLFTSGNDITASNITMDNARKDISFKFSDLNGNVTEAIHKIWAINN